MLTSVFSGLLQVCICLFMFVNCLNLFVVSATNVFIFFHSDFQLLLFSLFFCRLIFVIDYLMLIFTDCWFVVYLFDCPDC